MCENKKDCSEQKCCEKTCVEGCENKSTFASSSYLKFYLEGKQILGIQHSTLYPLQDEGHIDMLLNATLLPKDLVDGKNLKIVQSMNDKEVVLYDFPTQFTGVTISASTESIVIPMFFYFSRA